ncbi:MAG: tryptophan-rich sensory protein [Mariniblastus sp.]|nr:tryptophan-rich sensory protein [Mariniblastus sp.]
MNAPLKSHSNATLALAFVISIAICFSAAAIGGWATAGSVTSDWFVELSKPSWNPPNWLFGPVWSVLYFMMSVAAWLVWKKSGLKNAKLELGWFGAHLLLNVAWSVLFFGMQAPGWAAIEIIILWVSIAMTIVLFFRHSKLAAYLLTPYLAWVSFATFLNLTIWSLN